MTKKADLNAVLNSGNQVTTQMVIDYLPDETIIFLLRTRMTFYKAIKAVPFSFGRERLLRIGPRIEPLTNEKEIYLQAYNRHRQIISKFRPIDNILDLVFRINQFPNYHISQIIKEDDFKKILPSHAHFEKLNKSYPQAAKLIVATFLKNENLLLEMIMNLKILQLFCDEFSQQLYEAIEYFFKKVTNYNKRKERYPQCQYDLPDQKDYEKWVWGNFMNLKGYPELADLVVKCVLRDPKIFKKMTLLWTGSDWQFDWQALDTILHFGLSEADSKKLQSYNCMAATLIIKDQHLFNWVIRNLNDIFAFELRFPKQVKTLVKLVSHSVAIIKNVDDFLKFKSKFPEEITIYWYSGIMDNMDSVVQLNKVYPAETKSIIGHILKKSQLCEKIINNMDNLIILNQVFPDEARAVIKYMLDQPKYRCKIINTKDDLFKLHNISPEDAKEAAKHIFSNPEELILIINRDNIMLEEKFPAEVKSVRVDFLKTSVNYETIVKKYCSRTRKI